MPERILKQYSRQQKLREHSEKYFTFKKDGYMESVPYQQEISVQGSKIFNLPMAENPEPEIGRGIATSMGATRQKFIDFIETGEKLTELNDEKEKRYFENL